MHTQIRTLFMLTALFATLGMTSTGLVCAQEDKSLESKDEPQQEGDGNATIEALLDEAGMFYQKRETDDGQIRYRIVVEVGGESTIITARVHTWTWKRPDGGPLQSVYAFAQAAPPNADGKPYSAAVTRAVASRNDILLTGNYSITDEGIYCNTGFYIPSLDADLLESYFFALHWNRVNLMTDLTPILEAESAEN